jgi:hypothetical protein
MYQNNCTIIIYNIVQTFGSPSICFGIFRPSSGRYSTKKNTIMASYDIVKYIRDITGHYCILLSRFLPEDGQNGRRTATRLCDCIYLQYRWWNIYCVTTVWLKEYIHISGLNGQLQYVVYYANHPRPTVLLAT